MTVSSARSTRVARGTQLGVIVVVGGLLAPLAVLTLVTAAVALVQPQVLDYGEPIVYGQASRLLTGEPLYQPIDQAPFTITAYMPLYYALAAGLQKLVGPGFAAGRALSLLAGLTATGMVVRLAGRLANSAWAAGLGGLVFVALGFPGDTPWLALYRVDLVGVALSLGAIVILAGGATRRRTLAAAILAGLALLTKQTFFAASLAGVLWLWPLDRRNAVTFGAIVFAMVALACAVLELTTHAFIENTVIANVNPLDLSVFSSISQELLVRQAVPFALALVYVVVRQPWKGVRSRLLVLYWAASAVSLVGIAKVGANHNYWIELAAGTAVLGAGGASVILGWSARKLVGATAVATALLLAAYLGFDGSGSFTTSAAALQAEVTSLTASDASGEFHRLVDRVRAEPGAVLAEPMDVVVLAGRPILLEPLIYSLLLDAGRWDALPIVSRICNGDVSLLVLGYPLDVGAHMGFGRYTLWPPPVMAALQATMTLDGMQAGRYLYVPDFAPRQAGSAGLADVCAGYGIRPR